MPLIPIYKYTNYEIYEDLFHKQILFSCDLFGLYVENL